MMPAQNLLFQFSGHSPDFTRSINCYTVLHRRPALHRVHQQTSGFWNNREAAVKFFNQVILREIVTVAGLRSNVDWLKVGQ